MSTNTFCGAAGAITHAGLVPVLADVDPWSAVPTEDLIRAAVREVGGVSAMVVVHLGGRPGRCRGGRGGGRDRPRPGHRGCRARARHGGRLPAGRLDLPSHLLQLLRHEEPGHRRGRHGHDERRRLRRDPGPHPPARHVEGRVAPLHPRGELAVRRGGRRPQGEPHGRPGSHRPSAAAPLRCRPGPARRAGRPLRRAARGPAVDQPSARGRSRAGTPGTCTPCGSSQGFPCRATSSSTG